jgi:hypothetical protein
VKLKLDDTDEDRLDSTLEDEDRVEDRLGDEDVEDRMEEVDILENVDDRDGETLEDDEVEDFEDTLLAVKLEVVGLIEESEDVFELDGLDVWEFVEE